MNKNQRPTHRLKAFVAAVAVVATLLLGVPSPAVAAPAHSITFVTATTHQPLTAAAHQIVPARAGTAINGTTICKGAITAGYKIIYIAAFAIGFCPTWGFFQTPWGRAVGNWVTTVACKLPYYVWAATGRWTTC